jgi:hypothetical protein
MEIRFIDRSGKKRVVDGIPQFIAAVLHVELSSEALVFDGAGLRWKKASEIVERRAATSDPQLPQTRKKELIDSALSGSLSACPSMLRSSGRGRLANSRIGD